jgi:hypothetical protein
MKNPISAWIITACLCTAICAPAVADTERSASISDLVSLEFVDDRGRSFSSYPAQSERSSVHRAYLEARPETEYSIRVRNRSEHRIGLLIAVDGRNIISGERSELAASESMYILDPHQSASYSGWRTSSEAVNRFFFTTLRDSYASRIGDESAIGVIAAAVYRERPSRVRAGEPQANARHRPQAVPEAADRAPVAEAERSAQAGTGFGESQLSRAIRVAFSPQRRASAWLYFKYEWAEQLCARGVKRCGPQNRFWPEPAGTDTGFVPYPPG